MTHSSILIIVQWFGPWPGWMRCFLESCRANASVNWLLVGDAASPDDLPSNVRLKRISFDEYRALISNKLGIAVQWTDVYKLCDLKPALAAIHDGEVAGYDYWGYCDLDVIFGDIRHFYTPEVLAHDLITTHANVVSGHFTLLRNTPRMVGAFRKVPFWKRLLAVPQHKSFDEQIFSRLFLPIPLKLKWRRLFTPFLGGALCVERHSTNIPPLAWIDGSANWPKKWFWNRGRLTTDRSGAQEFLYLHFSHWQSNRWTQEAVAPWTKLDRLDQLPPGRIERFTISAMGFRPLDEAELARDQAPA